MADPGSFGNSRFIPAYAGNTISTHLRRCWTTVHPRICGEHFTFLIHRVRENGSSPHMRGTQGHAQWADSNNRFIPAYAGNTGF